MTDELTNAAEWIQIGPWKVSSELFLDVIFTNHCNRHCAYCIARTKTYCTEDPSRWQRTLEKAFELFNIGSIIILGGEATVDPRFWEKLADVERLAREYLTGRVILTTNGVRLTEPDFLERLCQSGITAVNISRMHYRQDLNDISFGGPTPTVKEIRHIHDALTAAGKTLRLNANIWRGNLDTITEMERFTDAFAGYCEAIKFSPLMNTAMFGTTSETDRFTAENAIPDEEIRVLYDRFAQRQKMIRKQKNVLGFVDYAEVIRNGQRVLLKYAQVEDKYDRERVIPTLKLYPNGCLSNEWNYRKDILDSLIT
ncbi:MAG: radical SAM protein [Clostridia bacterium]|nr:radical SAM protein [Clostridia bacterium]